MRVALLALSGVLLLAGASGCSDEAPTARVESEARSKILQPGRPGEGNATLAPDATVEQPPTNEADTSFVQMMVPHHAQALELCELARTRARDARVVALARRIEGAQGPEIVAMSSWLQARGLDVPESPGDLSTHGGHAGHSGSTTMPGMLTAREVGRLEAARGAGFDRRFLTAMIKHHRGAVEMAGAAMEAGSDTLALELASEIAAGQLAEIERLRDVRRSL